MAAITTQFIKFIVIVAITADNLWIFFLGRIMEKKTSSYQADEEVAADKLSAALDDSPVEHQIISPSLISNCPSRQFFQWNLSSKSSDKTI